MPSLIHTLIASSRPSTILGRIRTVISFAIKRMFRRRSFTHVLQKITERFSPAFANSDSTCSVPFIGNRARIFAPLNHAAIQLVQGMVTPSSFVRMPLDRKAPATKRFAVSQILARDKSPRTAFADTKPVSLLVNNHVVFIRDRPSAELLPFHLNQRL